MKFAYLVCFVALLQISSCQEVPEETTKAPEAATEAPEAPTSTIAFTTVVSAVSESSSTEIGKSETTSGPISTTTDNTVVESQSYESVGPDSTTDLATEESAEQSTTTDPSGKGVLVYPTALVVLVPLCIRLATINLVGVV